MNALGKLWWPFVAGFSIVVGKTPAGGASVQLLAPVDGASFIAPAEVTLLAGGFSDPSDLTRVEFFADDDIIGEVTTAPYTFGWNNVAPGPYRLSVQAHYASGQKAVSSPVQIRVLPVQPSIGINFATGNNRRFPLGDYERAGVVSQRFWNNLDTYTNGWAEMVNVRDSDGNYTTLDLFFDLAEPGENAVLDPLLSADHTLMKTFVVDTGGAGANSRIGVFEVPYPAYDVIVYSDGDNPLGDRVAQFRLGTSNIFLRDAAGANYSGTYIKASGLSDAGTNTAAGNYVRFNGLTTNRFTLTVFARSATDNIPRACVNAIQIIPSVYNSDSAPKIIRGPYLQSGSRSNVTVRWRTNRPMNSRVRYGTNFAALNMSIQDSRETVDHGLRLTDLYPNTKYFYAVGTSQTNLAAQPNQFFVTASAVSKPTRIWVLGDSGTANADAMAVRDAFYTFAGNRYTDVWLMLGDNAYNSGTDAEHQRAIFDLYPETLRQSVLWPTIGNHETAQDHDPPSNLPYFNIFELPRNGECGGLASGTERYYSFDHGNIHFICLDSMTSDRSSNGLMATWLEADLTDNTADWTIAFWHHPPYSKGSHDSDNPNGRDRELQEMREGIVPILESHAVDLVLSGHSHSYERSLMLYGHYGHSETLESSMIVQSGNGAPENPYLKPPGDPLHDRGTIYTVAGSSGQISSGPLDHPAMITALLRLGSLIVDIDNNTLRARFLTANGDLEDEFMIVKPPVPALSVADSGGPQGITLTLSAEAGRTYAIERSTDPFIAEWQGISTNFATTNHIVWPHINNGAATRAFYRARVIR